MKTKRSSWVLLLLLFALSSFVLTDHQLQGYEVGDKASDFKLKNVDGQMVSLHDFQNAKGYILVFTCNHCPCAAKYEERILALDKKYKTLGYPVVAINSVDLEQYPTESFSRMKARASYKKYTFPYLRDEDQSVAAAYGAPSTPYVFILQKSERDLFVKYTGAVDDNMQEPDAVKEKYAENALDQLITGKPVKISHTAVHGCSINIRKKG